MSITSPSFDPRILKELASEVKNLNKSTKKSNSIMISLTRILVILTFAIISISILQYFDILG